MEPESDAGYRAACSVDESSPPSSSPPSFASTFPWTLGDSRPHLVTYDQGSLGESYFTGLSGPSSVPSNLPPPATPSAASPWTSTVAPEPFLSTKFDFSTFLASSFDVDSETRTPSLDYADSASTPHESFDTNLPSLDFLNTLDLHHFGIGSVYQHGKWWGTEESAEPAYVMPDYLSAGQFWALP